MPGNNDLIPMECIERRILLLRGQKVMLSTHLAELYEVEPRALVQAVKRNLERFPSDFMFQLSWDEVKGLASRGIEGPAGRSAPSRSQNVILKRGRNLKYAPYAFTEQGVAMLSSVLRSPRAVQVNIEIMRAFVRLRRMIASNAELSHRIEEMEKRYDSQFKVVFEAIRQLMERSDAGATPAGETEEPRRRIGFGVRERRSGYRCTPRLKSGI